MSSGGDARHGGLSVLAEHLDLLDEALTDGDWGTVAELAWVAPSGPSTLDPGDREAAEGLLRRAEGCQERIRARLAGIIEELDGVTARRRAAARYAAAGELEQGP